MDNICDFQDIRQGQHLVLKGFDLCLFNALSCQFCWILEKHEHISPLAVF